MASSGLAELLIHPRIWALPGAWSELEEERPLHLAFSLPALLGLDGLSQLKVEEGGISCVFLMCRKLPNGDFN